MTLIHHLLLLAVRLNIMQYGRWLEYTLYTVCTYFYCQKMTHVQVFFAFTTLSRWYLKFHSSMSFGFFWWPSYFHSGTGYPRFCQLSRNKSHCGSKLTVQIFFFFFLIVIKCRTSGICWQTVKAAFTQSTLLLFGVFSGGGLISWQLAAPSIVFLVRLTKTLVFLRGACGRQCRDCAVVIHWSVSVAWMHEATTFQCWRHCFSTTKHRVTKGEMKVSIKGVHVEKVQLSY